MNKRGGFTFVELVVFIAVLGLVAILTVFGVTRYQETQQAAQTPQKTDTSKMPQSTPAPTTPEDVKLGAPTVTTTINSATQVTVNWTPAAHSTPETTYTLVRANDSNFTSGVVTQKGITTTSSVVTKLTAGKTYYFRVQAVSPNETSDYSNVTTNVDTSNTSVTITENSTQTVIKGSESTQATANAPAAFAITSSNDGKSLTAKASVAACSTGATSYYSWKANGTPWVAGEKYDTVTYSLWYGQSVTLKASVRCQKDTQKSAYTESTNQATYARPGMNLTLTAGDDNCGDNYCGRVINAHWQNVCGSGAPTIFAKQLSTLSNWKADNALSDSIKWKGATSPGVSVNYYKVNIGCTSAAASINVISAYKCAGCR